MINEELEAIRERVDKATKSNSISERDASWVIYEDIPKLLAEIERLGNKLQDVQQELIAVIQLLDGAYELLHDDDFYRKHPLAVDIINYFIPEES